jgi:hypothetical protein
MLLLTSLDCASLHFTCCTQQGVKTSKSANACLIVGAAATISNHMLLQRRRLPGRLLQTHSADVLTGPPLLLMFCLILHTPFSHATNCAFPIK